MGKLLWKPKEEYVKSANITRFIEFVNTRRSLKINTYRQLYQWSVAEIAQFWEAVWEFVGVTASQGYDKVVGDLTKFPGTKWFPGARLNFAENLLRYHDDKVALIGRDETKNRIQMTYKELYDIVARLGAALRKNKVAPGDMVVAYMPNSVETVVAMLGATSIGATWAACGTELGFTAALDRLEQIRPKILFTAQKYTYKGKIFNTTDVVEKIIRKIPTIEKVIVVSKNGVQSKGKFVGFNEFLPPKPNAFSFEQLPFDHPVYIMFSSGTTGKPKCLVQGAGGVLINHLKELILHTDLKRSDTIMYITSPTWMMWNWVTSSLATGAAIVVYNGNPNHPDSGAMWKLIDEEKVTVFGCSASYLNFLKGEGLEPKKCHDLSTLREISQTGSSLSAEGFEWVYNAVKADLHFNSISGGTDINGCFACGSPTLPVYAGELQAPALGMKIKAYGPAGNAVMDEQGELVCEAPSPSMPLYFWDDNEKYLDAYFRHYRDRRVWRHGDYILIHSDTGGITFYGRSDALLKPSGVRIGTGELYQVLEQIPEVADSLAVGQDWKDDQRVILFVKMAKGQELSEELKDKIRRRLRSEASPHHVPAKILEVPYIPYTFSMKKVELAVANIINNRPVLNREALINPDSLMHFEKLAPELQKG